MINEINPDIVVKLFFIRCINLAFYYYKPTWFGSGNHSILPVQFSYLFQFIQIWQGGGRGNSCAFNILPLTLGSLNYHQYE